MLPLFRESHTLRDARRMGFHAESGWQEGGVGDDNKAPFPRLKCSLKTPVA